MRLPDFTDDAGLIALRRSMGAVAPGSFSPNYRPDELTLAELEQLARDGKDVSIDDIKFGVKAIGLDGSESLVSAYVYPPRQKTAIETEQ